VGQELQRACQPTRRAKIAQNQRRRAIE